MDVAHQTAETARVALTAFLLAFGVQATGAAVSDQTYGLPLQAGELCQPTSEKNGAQIGDVVATGLVPPDELLVRQGFQNGVPSVSGRHPQEVEISRVVQGSQNFLARKVLRRDAFFEGGRREDVAKAVAVGPGGPAAFSWNSRRE